jgi:hypothetical protein
VFIKNQLLKKGGKVLFFVCFAVVLKLLIIFLFHVIWFRLYGVGLLIIILLFFKAYFRGYLNDRLVHSFERQIIG